MKDRLKIKAIKRFSSFSSSEHIMRKRTDTKRYYDLRRSRHRHQKENKTKDKLQVS